MSLPPNPENPGPFGIQHGYADVKFETHKYSDEPTPLPGQQSQVLKFVSSKTDKQHQKKYAKKAFGTLFNVLCK